MIGAVVVPLVLLVVVPVSLIVGCAAAYGLRCWSERRVDRLEDEIRTMAIPAGGHRG